MMMMILLSAVGAIQRNHLRSNKPHHTTLHHPLLLPFSVAVTANIYLILTTCPCVFVTIPVRFCVAIPAGRYFSGGHTLVDDCVFCPLDVIRDAIYRWRWWRWTKAAAVPGAAERLLMPVPGTISQPPKRQRLSKTGWGLWGKRELSGWMNRWRREML